MLVTYPPIFQPCFLSEEMWSGSFRNIRVDYKMREVYGIAYGCRMQEDPLLRPKLPQGCLEKLASQAVSGHPGCQGQERHNMKIVPTPSGNHVTETHTRVVLADAVEPISSPCNNSR